ncbi:hypothetical protein HER15_14040 [Tenacibaculum mesophilum]|uniref:Uncharacterized protein n=1 Tax=Tenacibaculum mesophilum TaxID=104268 RepID=A0AAE9SI55_9FLAO|nr:hypothetical protein [Tenacibaculum mesophilum]UTD16529.1 hypothetical protein HER15_14040 [Tenacibaculum mesophilum]GFD80272.1 hypothetical protein KUL118_31340 [Tenacibaculum sp. KUL118]
MNQKINKGINLNSSELKYDLIFIPIRSYISHTEEALNEYKKKLKEESEVLEAEKGYNPKSLEIYICSYFSKIQLESIFTTLFSMLEQELKKICEQAQSIKLYNFKLKDLSGNNDIEKARKYIVKVMDVNLDRFNDDWILIKKYQEIRNSFIHRQGKLRENNEIEEYRRQYEKLKIFINEDQVFMIESSKFLLEFIDLVVRFLYKVCDEIIDKNQDLMLLRE